MPYTRKYEFECVECRTMTVTQDHCLECGGTLCAECPRTLGDEHYCSSCYSNALMSRIRKNRTLSAFRRLHSSVIATLGAA